MQNWKAHAWIALALESQPTETDCCKSIETYLIYLIICSISLPPNWLQGQSMTQAVPGKHPHCCLKWNDLYFNPLYIYIASGLSSSGPGIYLARPQK